MKPLRKHVAIAIDGGGIRGIIVTRALTMLEDELGQPIHKIARLFAGTSTGSIISAGLATGMTASKVHELYLTMGESIFRKSWRTLSLTDAVVKVKFLIDTKNPFTNHELDDMRSASRERPRAPAGAPSGE